MIYLVTLQQTLFKSDCYELLSIEDSLTMINSWRAIQFDTETTGRNPHLCKLLCAQFGNDEFDSRIVVDCTTIDIIKYKEVLESKTLIGHNLKFDLQFLYNHNIIPRKVYDTMIVEQLLYLGFPHITVLPEDYTKYNYDFPYHSKFDKKQYKLYYELSFALNALTDKYLNIELDKTVRGQIIWRGLDEEVIRYAANDVMHLESIAKKQIQECQKKGVIKGAKVECDFVPCMAYLEWCGIHLDIEKWQSKMQQDKINLETSLKALNSYCVKHPKLQKWVYINRQGDLFTGFNLEPQWKIDWQKDEAMQGIRTLGFNLQTKDKKTGEDKVSVMKTVLMSQKGIDDTFLKLYFDYQGFYKVVSSFGQGHLDAINPKTGRLHTNYWQLGASSGRMSCGGGDDDDLCQYKKLSKGSCKLLNMQQLPHDKITRGCFTAMKGNKWVSCDYSALESRLGADIYQEKSMINEFLYGSGDIHSLCAYMVYTDKIPRDTPIKDIKQLYPELRSEVKPIEFSQQFGGSEFAIMGSMGCTIEKARAFKKAYDEGFPGITTFKQKGSEFVRRNGYVLMCKETGHKMYWWDHKKWLQMKNSFNEEFWLEYNAIHKPMQDDTYKQVKEHFKAAAKWDRMALNAPTQGTGIVILKHSQVEVFNWVVDNGYFGKILLGNLTHDEANWEYPETIEQFPKVLQDCMEKSASIYCKSLPIPAEPAIGDHWIH